MRRRTALRQDICTDKHPDFARRDTMDIGEWYAYMKVAFAAKDAEIFQYAIAELENELAAIDTEIAKTAANTGQAAAEVKALVDRHLEEIKAIQTRYVEQVAARVAETASANPAEGAKVLLNAMQQAENKFRAETVKLEQKGKTLGSQMSKLQAKRGVALGKISAQRGLMLFEEEKTKALDNIVRWVADDVEVEFVEENSLEAQMALVGFQIANSVALTEAPYVLYSKPWCLAFVFFSFSR